jgi:hypothetical protein
MAAWRGLSRPVAGSGSRRLRLGPVSLRELGLAPATRPTASPTRTSPWRRAADLNRHLTAGAQRTVERSTTRRTEWTRWKLRGPNRMVGDWNRLPRRKTGPCQGEGRGFASRLPLQNPQVRVRTALTLPAMLASSLVFSPTIGSRKATKGRANTPSWSASPKEEWRDSRGRRRHIEV